MKQEHWDDEQIESLLKQAPKVQDTRQKEEVFKRLQEEGAFSARQKQAVLPQKKFHWKPLLVSIASIFVLVLIASKFIGTTPDLTMNEVSVERTDSAINEDGFSSEMSDTNMARTFMLPQRTALYPEQVGESTPFTIGLTGDDAESVPVSILIPAEKIAQDFEGTPTKMELYTKYAAEINEEAMGFHEYHPFVGELTEEARTLTHHLPKEQPYDQASASMSNYIGVLVDTFADSYEEVAFVDLAGEPYEFSQAGTRATPLELNGEQTHYNYFLYTMRDGSQYISPNFRMSYEDVEAALLNMTSEANDIYQTLILPNVAFTPTVKGDVVTVTFTEPLDLEQQDAQAAMRMLEGMMLTAANFDKKVKFKNISPEQWYDFDFTKPMPMPIAPNLLDFSVIFK
ncbi:MAG: hypothetical protein ABS951_01245 [Solibacillus sp.]